MQSTINRLLKSETANRIAEEISNEDLRLEIAREILLDMADFVKESEDDPVLLVRKD